MWRHLRTKVPSIPSVLKPNVEDTDRQRLQLTVDENWSKQHEKWHQVHALPQLPSGKQVWLRDQNREGHVITAGQPPRSYLVKTDMRTLRRNRSALVLTNLKPATPTDGPTIAWRLTTARELKTTEGF